jgi:trk system potassium uptake protein TrkA
MYIIVVGCGRIGSTLVRGLMAVGHEVLVVDEDAERCRLAEEEMGSVAMVGDGCSIQVLREAGIDRAEVLVATLDRDDDNLAACQIAREMFKVKSTVAVVHRHEYEELFEKLGINTVVNATQLVISAIEGAISGRPLVHLVNLMGTNKRVVTLRVPEDSAVVGRALAAVPLPPETLIILVVKKGEPVVPSEETVIEKGDEILAVTTEREELELWQTLTEVAS